MNKYFIVSDVHGFYDEMMSALVFNGFDVNNPEHVFVSCGDLLDRGKQAKQCLSFVNNLPDDRKILIKGNHEDLMQEAIDRGYFKSYDICNKTVDSAIQLTGKHDADEALRKMFNYAPWKTYYDSCIDYYELNDYYILVHGWIPDNLNSGDWHAARWVNGFDAWHNGIVLPEKTIVCGHWHTSYANSKYHGEGTEYGPDAVYDMFVDEGIIGLDACTAVSKQVNVLVIDDKYGQITMDEYMEMKNSV